MKARLLFEIALARGNGPLLVACALLAIAAAGAAWAIYKAQGQRDSAQQRLAAAQLNKGETKTGAVTNAAERLANFYAALGKRSDLDQHMRKIFDAARKRGLSLDIGEYRLANDADGGFQRYQLELPVAGAFSEIQSFSQQVLRDLQFAALESMTFQREGIDASVVESQLRFVLFLTADQAGVRRPTK